MRSFLTILHKDLRLELRSGDSVLMLIALSLLLLIVLVFALDPAGGVRDAGMAASALWVALIVSGMTGASRVLLAERENGCLRGLVLSPVERTTIFAAKLAASFIFMAIAELASLLLLVLFFNLEFDVRLAKLLVSLAPGALGFAAIATLLAGVGGRARASDLLAPVLAIPLFVPALIAGVKASGLALIGAPLAASAQWLRILGAFDLLFLSAGYLLFGYVIGED
jgi:heme exporter protein B